jgi:hypothetical protein
MSDVSAMFGGRNPVDTAKDIIANVSTLRNEAEQAMIAEMVAQHRATGIVRPVPRLTDSAFLYGMAEGMDRAWRKISGIYPHGAHRSAADAAVRDAVRILILEGDRRKYGKENH